MRKIVKPPRSSRLAVLTKQRLATVTGGHNGTIIVESIAVIVEADQQSGVG